MSPTFKDEAGDEEVETAKKANRKTQDDEASVSETELEGLTAGAVAGVSSAETALNH